MAKGERGLEAAKEDHKEGQQEKTLMDDGGLGDLLQHLLLDHDDAAVKCCCLVINKNNSQ